MQFCENITENNRESPLANNRCCLGVTPAAADAGANFLLSICQGLSVFVTSLSDSRSMPPPAKVCCGVNVFKTVSYQFTFYEKQQSLPAERRTRFWGCLRSARVVQGVRRQQLVCMVLLTLVWYFSHNGRCRWEPCTRIFTFESTKPCSRVLAHLVHVRRASESYGAEPWNPDRKMHLPFPVSFLLPLLNISKKPTKNIACRTTHEHCFAFYCLSKLAR